MVFQKKPVTDVLRSNNFKDLRLLYQAAVLRSFQILVQFLKIENSKCKFLVQPPPKVTSTVLFFEFFCPLYLYALFQKMNLSKCGNEMQFWKKWKKLLMW